MYLSNYDLIDLFLNYKGKSGDIIFRNNGLSMEFSSRVDGALLSYGHILAMFAWKMKRIMKRWSPNLSDNVLIVDYTHSPRGFSNHKADVLRMADARRIQTLISHTPMRLLFQGREAYFGSLLRKFEELKLKKKRAKIDCKKSYWNDCIIEIQEIMTFFRL